MRTGICIQFLQRHVQETMIILEKGNLTNPRCTRCNIMVPWAALNGLHPNNTQCKNGVEWKRHRLVAEEMRDSTKRDFWACGRPLTSVTSFNYLRRIIMALDNDWSVVVGNLQKSWKKCDRM